MKRAPNFQSLDSGREGAPAGGFYEHVAWCESFLVFCTATTSGISV
jgi:hypothetical protein